jgi:hypothetical protein
MNSESILSVDWWAVVIAIATVVLVKVGALPHIDFEKIAVIPSIT